MHADRVCAQTRRTGAATSVLLRRDSPVELTLAAAPIISMQAVVIAATTADIRHLYRYFERAHTQARISDGGNMGNQWYIPVASAKLLVSGNSGSIEEPVVAFNSSPNTQPADQMSTPKSYTPSKYSVSSGALR